MKKYLVILAVAILISGCSSSGSEKARTATIDSVGAQVTKGVTTKDQVKALYGEPDDINPNDSGDEEWKYVYSRTTVTAATFIPVVNLFSRGARADKNEVIFTFDKKGVVQAYTVHASQIEAGNDLPKE
jgi:outer membrane protein assembly factor BamE (lipoprotein component of BamABCDE complex)